MSDITCKEIGDKTPDEVCNGIVSFIGKLDSGELLTGTPTVTATPSGLTFASVAVNTTARTLDDGTVVAIGQGVQFSVSGGASTTKYTIAATCSTTSTPAQTRQAKCTLWVRDS